MLSAASCDHKFICHIHIDYYVKIIGNCFHMLNTITFCVAQSEHIKRLQLY